MYKNVCTYLKARGIFLTPEEIEWAGLVTKHRTYRRNAIIMHQGKVVKKLFFLNKGIVRLFRIHEEVDYTLGLVANHEFISTPLYLLSGDLSSCALEALTDIEVLEWNKDDVTAIKEKVSKAYEIEQCIMHRLLTWLQDAQIDSICLTAEERYEKLMREQPELVHNIPLKYIASYFAIHQDSLSRIRKQFAQRTG